MKKEKEGHKNKRYFELLKKNHKTLEKYLYIFYCITKKPIDKVSTKLDAISVTSTDLEKSVKFYSLLGFTFSSFNKNEKHIEPQTKAGEVRLMIDTSDLIESITGSKPLPPNHSSFAILFSHGAINVIPTFFRTSNVISS